MKTMWSGFLSLFEMVPPESKYYRSTAYRLLKLGGSVAVLALLFFRGRLITVDEKWDGVITFALIPVIYGCLRCLYISVAELICPDYKETQTDDPKKRTMLPVEDLVRLAAECDIVEIRLRFAGKTVPCGASCDSSPTELFDKRYYFGDEEFGDLQGFRDRLLLYSTDRQLCVLSIDDLPPDQWNLPSAGKS